MFAFTPFHTAFVTYAGPAMAIMLIMVLCARCLFPFWVQCISLVLGTLILWVGIFLGTHYGYGAWQSMPNPPEEAFADGAQLTGSVIFGWIPAGMATYAWWWVLNWFMRRTNAGQHHR
jgi:hypothetical protein